MLRIFQPTKRVDHARVVECESMTPALNRTQQPVHHIIETPKVTRPEATDCLECLTDVLIARSVCSRPAIAALSVECVPSQSETTKPGKSRPLLYVVQHQSFSPAQSPITLFTAHDGGRVSDAYAQVRRPIDRLHVQPFLEMRTSTTVRASLLILKAYA